MTDTYVLREALEKIAAMKDTGESHPGLHNTLADIALTALAEAEKPTRADEQYARLKEVGKGTHAVLAEMVAALECDYDRLEELREERKSLADEGAHHELLGFDSEHGEELQELEAAAGDCADRDDAEKRIHEAPLSIEVRSDWYSVGDDQPAPSEFNILLGTGGPATRIIGELDERGQPTLARLQTQDWGTPWTDYLDGDSEMLLTYCRCFYFGEG